MPRTITIDNVDVTRMQLLKNPSGEVEVYVEYHLKAGNQVVQTKHEQVTVRLGGPRKAAALAIFEAIAQDVTTAELA